MSKKVIALIAVDSKNDGKGLSLSSNSEKI